MVVSILLGAPAVCAGALPVPRRHDVPAVRAADAGVPGGDPGAAAGATVGFIRLGLYDTPLGVGLMHSVLAMPFAVLISASLFQAIPYELEEAAWVFGCSGPKAFLRVVLPLALPGIAATAIFAFVISWNEVFAATVLTVRHRTLTAYLLTVLSESPLHVQFAGGFILIVPSVLFIFLVRRHLFSLWGIAGR